MTVRACDGTVDRAAPLAALFLVSFGAVAFEIALTRYFAVAKWSEYGYWVISIVLAGFAFSGVAMAVARDFFVRHAARIFAVLPPLLVLSAAAGYWLATVNPFNPLQLQNQATLAAQLWNIAFYYVALLPFYVLAGLFISLCFLVDTKHIGRIYGTDLTGAGIGALSVLLLMFAVPPFRLVPWLLGPLAASAFFIRPRWVLLATAAALALSETALLGFDQARINDFKAIYAPLHVPDSRVLAELPRPGGVYDLLDDFTERVDTDVSNDSGLLHLPGPPTALGLYRDGNRIAALPRGPHVDAAYAGATLSALPYVLLPHPRVLLAGASGGFRIAEAHALGAATIDAAEPEPVLREAVRHGLAGMSPIPLPPGTRLRADPPLALAQAGRSYDLVDISGDFLDSAEANATSFSVEAIAAYLRAVGPNGLVSIPVSIREFPAYATRMLATVRAALRLAGLNDPRNGPPGMCVSWSRPPMSARRRSPPCAPGAMPAVSMFPIIQASTSRPRAPAFTTIYPRFPSRPLKCCRWTARMMRSPTRRATYSRAKSPPPPAASTSRRLRWTDRR
jgi:hypothetical protein